MLQALDGVVVCDRCERPTCADCQPDAVSRCADDATVHCDDCASTCVPCGEAALLEALQTEQAGK